MKKFNENNGITLLELIITIIVLVILAGVAINTPYGENGIIEKAKLVKKMGSVSNEREAIELNIACANIDKMLENQNKYYVGECLFDRTLENGDKWKIIINEETKKQYGTGYRYISKNSEIPNYGKTQYEWIINYSTGEVIQLDDKYVELNFKSTLAIIDGLIFNMDATNVTRDISSWGNNVTLRYFDETQYDTIEKRVEAYNKEKQYENVLQFDGYDRNKSDSALDYVDIENNAFKFNGNNYIEIYNSNGFDFSKGFTIELYGNFKDYLYATNSNGFLSILGIWNGKYTKQCSARFGYYEYKVYYSLLNNYKEALGSWSDKSYPWNQQYDFENFTNRDIYISITFKTNGKDKVTQAIYVDGELLEEGWLSYDYYNEFVNLGKSLNYIELGRCTMGKVSNWCYTRGICYAARIYNRCLTEKEIKSNVIQTKMYRETLK